MYNIRFLMLLFIAFGFFSCNKKKIEELKNENLRLKNELTNLKQELNKYELKPIITPNKNTLNLGDEYGIRLDVGISNNTNFSKLLIYDSTRTNIIDTIDCNPQSGSIFYTEHPRFKGEHTFNGELVIKTILDTVNYDIKMFYDVK